VPEFQTIVFQLLFNLNITCTCLEQKPEMCYHEIHQVRSCTLVGNCTKIQQQISAKFQIRK